MIRGEGEREEEESQDGLVSREEGEASTKRGESSRDAGRATVGVS